MNIPNTILTLLAGIVITLVSLWYGQNHNLLPVAASEEAAHVDSLFNVMMTISVGLVILVQGVLIISAIKYRRRKGDNTDGPPIHGNIPLEILWTAIPAVIVLGISVYSFEIYNEMGGLDPMASHEHSINVVHNHPMKGAAMAATLGGTDEPAPSQPQQIALGIGASPDKEGKTADVVVNVTGLQFAWIFAYPDLGITSGELHLPSGKESQLNMTANDVIHAMWIPELRLKQDVIPGRTTELRFTVSKTGEYPVICAELCGGYHGAMKTQLIVQSPEEFDSWVKSQQEIALTESMQTAVAVSPADMLEGEYLAPYAEEMGVNSEMLSHLHK